MGPGGAFQFGRGPTLIPPENKERQTPHKRKKKRVETLEESYGIWATLIESFKFMQSSVLCCGCVLGG